ncbi:zinc ABC transporter substrate-binding protein [Streptomyces sp. PSKA28]|uniref:Zinc ABC transporter substrate-binding protein n=1 Tax=Streptomyces himalayensis subsp. himalayensis TaxID=2756131 RepID=A0A7W0I9U6_9ACTN|nr:zinc ABC transporter substrate-binding protein [Streptomyces himalayensis subsp. himalayensis]
MTVKATGRRSTVHHPQRLTAAAALAAVAATSLTACGTTAGANSGDAQGGGTVKVVATTTQVADFVRNIGGDRVTVTQLVKPNASPHEYEPTPAALQAIGEAALLVKNGVGLEDEWLPKTAQASGFDGETVDTSTGITLRQGEDHETGKAADDPHIWHNPLNAKIMSETIEKALIKADPQHKADYQDNFTAYAAKLDALDKDIAEQINSLPADDRKLVTNHDAFGYYIDRYQLTYVGSVIPDFSDQAELSGNQLDSLVKKIKKQKVKAVFGETSLPPKTAQAIARQSGVKVVAGDGSLYGDSLGPKGSAGDTYLKSMEFNTKTIVDALK